ncbi:SDR family NAD(P)-dependent oxidoreductase [Microlunatus parietis]|uniref:NAD(P)-dependent dehydrogenase (Short-subunit alcohol dehydrogenase family) n=1 Tax=Microlunatus parietis TaxID=682979 RepID=A0A7Y9IEZ8_9ACTN|nr:SDR family NAD(P)-dependent oxidoreductase [Microlunatus parietis]NYE75590.1 NAD(P)-dependent dehydrogenase (short-subunit alcohol dehydrogenase family) [Microlunatus parietis]
MVRSHPGSHLVNVSSLFGLIAPAGQAAYATSKFAVRGFTESLRAERTPAVGVTVVHPGGIRTGIAPTVPDLLARITPGHYPAALSLLLNRRRWAR